jgi:hypothetical protein
MKERTTFSSSRGNIQKTNWEEKENMGKKPFSTVFGSWPRNLLGTERKTLVLRCVCVMEAQRQRWLTSSCNFLAFCKIRRFVRSLTRMDVAKTQSPRFRIKNNKNTLGQTSILLVSCFTYSPYAQVCIHRNTLTI